jgi:hypothetical protein
MRTALHQWVVQPRWPFVLAILAAILSLPTLWTGLVGDDYIHRAILMRLPGFTGPLDHIIDYQRAMDRWRAGVAAPARRPQSSSRR